MKLISAEAARQAAQLDRVQVEKDAGIALEKIGQEIERMSASKHLDMACNSYPFDSSRNVSRHASAVAAKVIVDLKAAGYTILEKSHGMIDISWR